MLVRIPFRGGVEHELGISSTCAPHARGRRTSRDDPGGVGSAAFFLKATTRGYARDDSLWGAQARGLRSSFDVVRRWWACCAGGAASARVSRLARREGAHASCPGSLAIPPRHAAVASSSDGRRARHVGMIS